MSAVALFAKAYVEAERTNLRLDAHPNADAVVSVKVRVLCVDGEARHGSAECAAIGIANVQEQYAREILGELVSILGVE